MPKKRNSIPFSKPSSSAHPSLTGRASDHQQDQGNASVSVNEKLQHLRLAQNGPSSSGKPFEAPPPHTLHPALRAILQIPDGFAPRPRPALRVSGLRRLPPGPRAPESWLVRRERERRALPAAEDKAVECADLPGYDMPKRGSIVDTALRKLAQEWEFYAEYEQFYLPMLPVRMKELLLHYLATGSPQIIDKFSLNLLFQDETAFEGATGAEGLIRLDLSKTIGASLQLRELKQLFVPGTSTHSSKPALHLTNAEQSDPSESKIPEDWDTSASGPLLGQTSSILRFQTVTHLSLACPVKPPSWSALLSLLPNLPLLTHLSLAYWPVPTLSPNSLTAYTATPTGPVQYSGSNFYSSSEDDWSEAASVIRRLSKSTFSLSWLDLTGNWPWVKCLGYPDIDWSDTWGDMEVVRIGQGPVPDDITDAFGDGGPDGMWDLRTLASSVDKITNRLQRDHVKSWCENEERILLIEATVRERIRRTAAEKAKEAESSANNPPSTGSSTLSTVASSGNTSQESDFQIRSVIRNNRSDYLDSWTQRGASSSSSTTTAANTGFSAAGSTGVRSGKEPKQKKPSNGPMVRTKPIRFEGGRSIRGRLPKDGLR